MVKAFFMKFIVSVLLIAVLAAVVAWFLPWWTVAIVAFIIGGQSKNAFLAGFCGVALCWLVAAVFRDMANDHILSGRMAVLFKLPNYGLFICVTVFIGGLIGGLSAWSGALLTRPQQ